MNDELFGDWIDEFLSEQTEDEYALFDDDYDANFTDDYGVNGYE